MIASRQTFLTRFFASLEANGVRYCIQRNYDHLCADAATDLDLIVSSYSLHRFERCLREAAEPSGFHFVHTARYTNYSQVFWHPVAGFVRVDFETDVRWRLFTVLNARAVLDARRRHQDFYIPSPEHEIVILYIAAIWRGELSERYRRQLAVLYAACPDKDSLHRTLVAAFGRAGHELTSFETRQPTFDRRFFTRLRLSLVFRTLHIWPLFVNEINNLRIDVFRFFERLFKPAGSSLLFVSSNEHQAHFSAMYREIEFLFPIRKNLLEQVDLRSGRRFTYTWKMRWRRVRTMFKGGLYVRAYLVDKDSDIPRALRSHARYIYTGRTFICSEDSTGNFCFGHVKSGFMASVEGPARVGQAFSKSFILFVSDVLEHEYSSALQLELQRPGLFCVMVGLDGSGKTTLGRNLCDVAGPGGRFRGIRYFHWRPKNSRRAEWPLPDYRETPRKAAASRNIFNTTLSAFRVLKNVALVRCAWHLRMRPLMRRGYLVIVDRYYYNYLLDPVSVKFSGPAGLLKFLLRLFPTPDVVVKLRAPSEVLLARKRELPPAEMARQVRRLEEMNFSPARTIVADATRPAKELAHAVMGEILNPTARN